LCGGLRCVAPISFLGPHQRLACCRARLLRPRLHGSSNSLCHERLRGRRMAGAFSRMVFQHPLCHLDGAGFSRPSTRRRICSAKMDTPRCRHPAWHRHYAACHGRLLCHCAAHAFDTATVLRHRLLDRLLSEHGCYGTLATKFSSKEARLFDGLNSRRF